MRLASLQPVLALKFRSRTFFLVYFLLSGNKCRLMTLASPHVRACQDFHQSLQRAISAVEKQPSIHLKRAL
jgi:hypothetical protein